MKGKTHVTILSSLCTEEPPFYGHSIGWSPRLKDENILYYVSLVWPIVATVPLDDHLPLRSKYSCTLVDYKREVTLYFIVKIRVLFVCEFIRCQNLLYYHVTYKLLFFQVTFVAVNCWYSLGSCRQQNNFLTFPVFFFYHSYLDGFRYNGEFSQ